MSIDDTLSVGHLGDYESPVVFNFQDGVADVSPVALEALETTVITGRITQISAPNSAQTCVGYFISSPPIASCHIVRLHRRMTTHTSQYRGCKHKDLALTHSPMWPATKAPARASRLSRDQS